MAGINYKIGTISSKFHYPYEGIFGTGSGPSYIIKEATGNGYINLTNAVRNRLIELKAYGGTEQRNLPSGYTELDGITNDNDGYIDTGIIADVDDMEFDIIATISSTSNVSWYILQSRVSGGAPIYGISGSAGSNTIIGAFSGTNINVSNIQRIDGHTYHINFVCKNGTGTITVEDLTDNTTSTDTGTYTFSAASTNIGLFNNIDGGGTIPGGNTYIKSAYIKKSGVKVFDYIACTYNNANGFYDTVSESFKSATVGSFTAGPNAAPTPTTPMNIVCNNGVLKVSPNLFDKNSADIERGWYSVDSQTVGEPLSTLNFSSNYHTSAPILVLPGATYTVVGSGGNSPSFVYLDSNMCFVSGFKNENISISSRTFTVPNDPTIKYLRFPFNTERVDTCQLELGETETPYKPYGQIYVDGTVETIGVHRKNLFNLATNRAYLKQNAEYTVSLTKDDSRVHLYAYDENDTNLGSAATWSSATVGYVYETFTVPAGTAYVAFREIDLDKISNVQIELGSTATEYEPYFDGGTATTEMLLKVGDYADVQEILSGNITRNVGIKVLDGTEGWDYMSARFTLELSDKIKNKVNLLCNYFTYSSATSTNMPDLSIISYTSANIGVRYDRLTSVDQFKQWLATQYANGTPVIVLYPLEIPTTETVAGQTMNISAGSSTIEITQASIDNLGLYAKYKATA